MNRLLLFTCATLFSLLNLQGQGLGSPEKGTTVEVQPRLITPIQAIVPLPLQNTAMQHPQVIAKVQVSGKGRVEDLVVLEASHIGLASRAESLLRKALIDPGNVRPNESIRFDMIIPFLYPADLGLTNKTTSDDIQGMINSVQNDKRSLHYYPAEKLDESVAIVDRGLVYKPEDENGHSIAGRAVVELYINHEGQVRLPRVVSSNHDEVALAAAETFADMRFTIPRVNGQPAITKIRLPYVTD